MPTKNQDTPKKRVRIPKKKKTPKSAKAEIATIEPEEAPEEALEAAETEEEFLDAEVVVEESDETAISTRRPGDPIEKEWSEEDEEELAKAPSLVKSSALQQYLNEISRYPLLTREEERELAVEAYENDDKNARARLVTSNLRLVVKIAMEYRRAYSQVLDLIQEGNAGLVQAVNRYNPYVGAKISTYSAWWIKAYILKFLMDNKSLVRMGTTDAQRKLFNRLNSEMEKMYALTHKFDAKLLAERIGVKESDVVEMRQRLTKNDVYLDTPVGEDGESRQVDLFESHTESQDSILAQKEVVTLLKKGADMVAKDLGERDKYIFEHRIMSDDPVTLQEVGTKFGVSRERARQLEARVIKKIGEKIKALGLDKNAIQ